MFGIRKAWFAARVNTHLQDMMIEKSVARSLVEEHADDIEASRLAGNDAFTVASVIALAFHHYTNELLSKGARLYARSRTNA